MAKLFIPGPTDVSPAVLAAQNQPMIGHRSQAFYDLFDRVQAGLREVFQTEHRVFVTASSGSGLQEAALRNLVDRRALMCVCGAFGDRWHTVAVRNGVPADRLDAEWGHPNTPERVAEQLDAADYDLLAVVHNETSTGVENSIADICAAAKQARPDIMVAVDAVSSMAGVDLPTDDWALDVVLTSSQKCFALPPGLAFAAVSDAAMARAATIEHRGWYFDFLDLEKYLVDRKSTPATPAVSLLYALDLQLDHILQQEGLQARFDRHAELAAKTQAWAEAHFALYAEPGFRSKTVTTIRKQPPIDVPALNRHLAEHGMMIANGYGRIKDETFRIGHMGEISVADLDHLLAAIDDFVGVQQSV